MGSQTGRELSEGAQHRSGCANSCCTQKPLSKPADHKKELEGQGKVHSSVCLAASGRDLGLRGRHAGVRHANALAGCMGLSATAGQVLGCMLQHDVKATFPEHSCTCSHEA